MRGKTKQAGWNALLYAVYAILIVFFLGPIFWVISLSLKDRAEIFQYPPRLLPAVMQFENYWFILTNSQIPVYLWNSFKVASALAVGAFIICIPASYAFSRFNFKGKSALLLLVLSFQMIAPVVIVVPLYTMMDAMGLLNTHLGLILLFIGVQVPFSVWLLKGFFDSVPKSIDESAMIDGATRMQTLLSVILPTSIPGLAAVAIFNFIFGWAEFVLPVVMLSRENLLTFSVGIFTFQSGYGTAWHLIAAASVLGLLPILVMFIGFQRLFVAGLTAGAVKE